MTDKPKHPENTILQLVKLIEGTAKQTHASVAITRSAYLELGLERIIKKAMLRLPRDLDNKLFKGYGPLSSFSAKIDIAYSLKYISNDYHRTLHAVREVRNLFAHTYENLHFDSDEPALVKATAKLPKPKKILPTNKLHLFIAITDECAEYLQYKIGFDEFDNLPEEIRGKGLMPKNS